jgi:nucleoid-associated protein YgaU
MRDAGVIPVEPTSSCLATNLPAVTNTAPVAVALPYTTYVVKPGDTLSKLSEQFLGKRSRWPEIVTANPGLIPEKLRTGQTIRLPAVPK